MPETYIFRLERPAQVIDDRSITRKIITFRVDSKNPKELARSFGDFLLSCGYAPSVVRDAMKAAGGGGLDAPAPQGNSRPLPPLPQANRSAS